MTKNYEIRHYELGDEHKIVTLLDEVFKGWPHIDIPCTPIEHWEWKYLKNPDNRIFVTVAYDEDKIVGCYHGAITKIKMGEEYHISGCVSDLAVDPEYRRMGIWNNMNEFRGKKRDELGVEISYWMSSNPIVINKYQNIRPHFPHPIINLVRINDIDLHLEKMPMEREWLMKIGFNAVKRLNKLGNIFRKEYLNDNLETIDVQSFGLEYDEFWEKVSDSYDMVFDRRRERINWRYCDPRAGDYIVKKIGEKGSMLGYAVLKINRWNPEYSVGFIVDFITLLGRIDVAYCLIHEIISFFDDNDINIINALMVKGHPYKDVYNKLGFLDSRYEISVFFNPNELAHKLASIKSSPPGKTYYAWGDHDSLPISSPSLHEC